MLKRFAMLLFVLTLGMNMVQAQEGEPSPAAAVEEFYTWYLDFIGTGEDFRNPLAERAYHDSLLLTGEFIAQVDELLASLEEGGYDPFLQAQDVPTWFHVGRAEMAGDEQSAVVAVYTSFPEHVLSVRVVRMDDRWLIAGVSRGELATPEDVVNSFYARHMGYIAPRDEGRFVNPMVVRTYQADPLLTGEFIAGVDALLERWQVEYGGYVADPFLCAQAVPSSLTVEEARYRVDRQAADVVVRTSFPGHAVTVDLVQRDEQWLINNIRCGETRTPEGAVKSFYAWYLDYHRWNGEGEHPNALVDQAYHDSDLLTAEFVARVDAMLAGMGDGGYDPFLCAQDLPDAVRVVDEPQISGDSARLTVETSFEGHAFDVVLTRIGESWQISDVVCQPAGEK